MKQREVKDRENTSWVCVQAFSGTASGLAEKAAEKLQDEEGRIPVVCTPTGGAQSVRVQLPDDWAHAVSDEELLKSIESARK